MAIDDAVYGAIRQAMLSGGLRPGTSFREPVLARLLKVSRGSVRKALYRLVHERCLEAVPTAAPRAGAVGRGAARLYEVRGILEDAVVAKLAVERPTARLEAEVACRGGALAVKSADRTPVRLSTVSRSARRSLR